MSKRILVSLESLENVVAVGVSDLAGRRSRGVRATAAAAKEHDYGVLFGLRAQFVQKRRVRLRVGIGLPFDTDAGGHSAYKIPLRPGTDIDQLGAWCVLHKLVGFCRQ